MKKAIRTAVLWGVVAVFLLSASAALAEVRRGDENEEVYDLQQLLFETGWLFEDPDGIFGKRTENAVKSFEEFAELPVDGVADDEMILALAASLEELNGNVGFVSEYFGEDVVGYFTGLYGSGEYEGDGWDDGEPDGMFPMGLSVLFDGNRIYYAGDIDGQGCGVYEMDADGGSRRRISGIQATLKAALNGSLLVWRQDGSDGGSMEVLWNDGTLETAGYSNCRAIADNGRFYFGGTSVDEKGWDHQWMLSSDPELHDNYYPIEVVDGYLYYIDANGGAAVWHESAGLPAGDVELSRLNLETGEIELLSGAGTFYLGIEDGVLYYTRENFDAYDDESGSTFEVQVDEGLYAMDLETLTETTIAEISDDLLTFEFYQIARDGVVYGEYSNFNADEAVFQVIRRRADGTELPALNLNNNDIMILCVEDNILFGYLEVYTETEESYTVEERIVMYDLVTGGQTGFTVDGDEVLGYTESRPAVTVSGGRVYFRVQERESGAELLKSMAMDGSDVRTLVRSKPAY